jgi:hypothetical protein
MKKTILLFFFLPILSNAQTSKKDSIWLPMKAFLGEWEGEGEGESGKGKYKRTYELVLNNNYIEVKNQSTYPPSKNYPNGEIHKDQGFISYDKGQKKFKLRQFHIEGFVNKYTLDSLSSDNEHLVFMSEEIENIPKGYRAKETYHFKNESEFEEIFEIAEPNKDFEVYSKATLKRIKY